MWKMDGGKINKYSIKTNNRQREFKTGAMVWQRTKRIYRAESQPWIQDLMIGRLAPHFGMITATDILEIWAKNGLIETMVEEGKGYT